MQHWGYLKENQLERFAYIKYNDVAAEVRTICDQRPSDVYNGPMNYIVNFLEWTQNNQTMVVSFDSPDTRDRTCRCGQVTAKTIRNLTHMRFLNGKLGELAQMVFETFYIFMLLRSFRPTWILCSRIKGALFGCYLYSRRYNVRLVVSRHGSIDIRNKKNVVKLISKLNFYVVRRAAAILCHGPYLRDQLLAQSVKRNKIFEFNLSYRNLLSQNGSPARANGKTILYLGRLRESKGAIDLFKACRKLLQDNADLKLAYAGTGECLEKLRDMVKADELEDQVMLYGHVDHDSIRDIIENCSFLVMPTRAISDEGRPKSAIEEIGRAHV